MKDLIVIDDFYSNPEAVREFALTRVEYLPQSQLPEGFLGTESKQSYFTKALVNKISSALGEQIEVDPSNYSFGVFCKTFAKDERSRSVHIDQSDWTGLIYLSRPEDCRGGTSFYQHKVLGWDRVPAIESLEKAGYRDRHDFVNRFLSEEGRNLENWKVLARVGMKFNRLVLFRAGEMFHAADGYFGATDQDCRLTQLFFLKTRRIS